MMRTNTGLLNSHSQCYITLACNDLWGACLAIDIRIVLHISKTGCNVNMPMSSCHLSAVQADHDGLTVRPESWTPLGLPRIAIL